MFRVGVIWRGVALRLQMAMAFGASIFVLLEFSSLIGCSRFLYNLKLNRSANFCNPATLSYVPSCAKNSLLYTKEFTR